MVPRRSFVDLLPVKASHIAHAGGPQSSERVVKHRWGWNGSVGAAVAGTARRLPRTFVLQNIVPVTIMRSRHSAVPVILRLSRNATFQVAPLRNAQNVPHY